MFKIYWLLSESRKDSYIGYSRDIKRRMKEHATHQVRTTENFIEAKGYILETVDNIKNARKRERYWKSSAGRKKLKEYFNKISN